MSVTRLKFRVSLATLEEAAEVALAMPPPASVAVLRVTVLKFKVTVPPAFSMPPPLSADPPVIVTLSSDRFPPGPSTSKTRTAPVPSIVAPLPFIAIRVVTGGSPSSYR